MLHLYTKFAKLEVFRESDLGRLPPKLGEKKEKLSKTVCLISKPSAIVGRSLVVD
jgi:hypothetical protein